MLMVMTIDYQLHKPSIMGRYLFRLLMIPDIKFSFNINSPYLPKIIPNKFIFNKNSNSINRKRKIHHLIIPILKYKTHKTSPSPKISQNLKIN